MKIVCTIPADLPFFKQTVEEVIRLHSPERPFEDTVLKDLLEHIGSHEADDAKVVTAIPVFWMALRDYMSDIFLINLGKRLWQQTNCPAVRVFC